MRVVLLALAATGCHLALPLDRGGQEDSALRDDAVARDSAIDNSTDAPDGAIADSGPAADAAPATDMAPPPDAAPAVDTAPSPDAVPPLDAAPQPDAGPAPDTAPQPDAGQAPDAAPTPDAAPPSDSGTTADSGAKDTKPPVVNPAPELGPQPDGTTADAGPPRLVITEIMVNPKSSEPATEWFELYNEGGASASLLGWSIADDSASHVITANISVAPGAYVVLAAVESSVLASVYAYNPSASTTGIALANDGDQLTLRDAGNAVVDQVIYPASWGNMTNEGSSWSLMAPGLDNANPANWCIETAAAKYDKQNHGTPGQPAGCP